MKHWRICGDNFPSTNFNWIIFPKCFNSEEEAYRCIYALNLYLEEKGLLSDYEFEAFELDDSIKTFEEFEAAMKEDDKEFYQIATSLYGVNWRDHAEELLDMIFPRNC